MDKKTEVYVLYSYGHKDESVWINSVFYKKENADEKLNELSKAEKDGRLYYIQTAFLEDLKISEN